MLGAFLANSAIRCSLVETLSGPDVPCIFPSSGSVARLPSPSAGSLGVVPLLHRYGGELRLPAAPPAALRYLRTALTIARSSSSLPHRVERAEVGPGLFVVRAPVPPDAMETTGPPRFLGNPCACMPCSSTPAGPRCQAIAAPRCCRRSENHDGPREQFHFEAQSHGPHAPCVRFAAGVTPVPRNTRFRLVANLCRAGLSRRVPP